EAVTRARGMIAGEGVPLKGDLLRITSNCLNIRNVLKKGAAAPWDFAMIVAENLTKYFGPVLALDRISFHVAKGELVGLLGPNGAGKTTTMRILTSYLPATSGSARVAGFDVRNQSMEARQQIGYLPEN